MIEQDWLSTAFEQHATPLLRLAMLLSGSRANAEDLVQDAFVSLVSVVSRPDDAMVFAYLRRTVINRNHNHFRHLSVVRRHNLARTDSDVGADMHVLQSEATNAIVGAIGQLPIRQRECIVLRYYAGLSEHETAEALGISQGSVKTHLTRAKGELASKLKELL